MIRTWTLAALAASMIMPSLASAQAAPRRPSRPRVRVESGPGSVFAFSDSRGRIGVVVDTRADATGDKVGARIDGITPGGPAAKAGLQAGDGIPPPQGDAPGGAGSRNHE